MPVLTQFYRNFAGPDPLKFFHRPQRQSNSVNGVLILPIAVTAPTLKQAPSFIFYILKKKMTSNDLLWGFYYRFTRFSDFVTVATYKLLPQSTYVAYNRVQRKMSTRSITTRPDNSGEPPSVALELNNRTLAAEVSKQTSLKLI